ncbi:hypothetical protein B0O99DRAFT_691504 [Bisporella sp. PMI_857]|nr:hypothetical protein B0O99DRAFT_691504 [Bisporella sp. PMI_857]
MPPQIANSRAIWSLLKTVALEPKGSKQDIDNDFDRVKGILQQRFENGVQSPFRDKTRAEFLQIIDSNTTFEQYEEPEDDHGYIIDHQQEKISDTSILNHPASLEAINTFEQRLHATLSADFKELLTIFNGINPVRNSHYHQSFLASSSKLKLAEDILGSPHARSPYANC